MNILKSDLIELRDAIQKKQVKATEVVSAFLNQIHQHNKNINAFVEINDRAMEAAQKMDEAIAANKPMGPLAGLPVGIKDMLCTRGIRTTAGSKILHNFIPPYSSTVVERLESAGAITIGKCNLDEFAMGSSTETSHFGVSRNPWNFEYVPGGSSGGSAAAVAAGMAPAAIGTDTGGSIRQPASFCNVVGVKPTYGRVSRYGIIAFASSLDQAGPFTRSVRDSALILEVICGKDPMDSTTSSRSTEAWSKNLNPDLKGYRIGVSSDALNDNLDPAVKKSVEDSIKWVKEAGAEIVEVQFPNLEYAVPVYYMIATSEASSNLARYDGVRYGYRADFSREPAKNLEEFYCRTRGEGFGTEVKRRIMLGTFALSSGYYDAYYLKASQVRRLIYNDFIKAFSQCDVVLGPVSSSPAFKLGERIDDPLTMYMNDKFTTSANLAGIPGMSVPAAFSKDGLPIGVQLNASHFAEQKMLNVALAIENAAGVKERMPNVVQ